MSVLVTGAAGFIGRYLIDELRHREEVWALTRRTPPAATGVNWIEADLASPGFLFRLPDRVDTVIHLAQSTHYREFPDQALDIFDVNLAATVRLLDWSRRVGVRRFVLASSGGADREHDGNRPTYYLATKRSAELLAASYATAFSVTILRLFFCYGAGQRSSMLIPRLIQMVENGLPIKLAGPDGIRINPVHVSDATTAVVEAAALDGHTVCDIAGPEVLSLRAIAEVIGRKVGRAPKFDVDENAPPDELIGDIATMRERLAAPTRTFESGVDDLLAAPRP